MIKLFISGSRCEDCDIGLVFWNGYSKGSESNIKYLKKLNKKVYIVKV